MKDGLPRVQQEVLMMLFKGLTVEEIALARHREHKTIEHCVTNMLKRTETRNSRELIYEALSRGWITPPNRYIP
jgi:DNA-binding NarL/FixJ family response regulator